MKRFIPNLFLLGFVISTSFVEASDLRDIEEKAAQRHLNNFIEVLKDARNVSVNSNTMPLNNHKKEQIAYCGALLNAIKTKNGTGVTVPTPAMSTGRNGNETVLDYIKGLTASPASCPVDLSKVPERWREIEAKVHAAGRKIPPTLVDYPQYPRLYSVYQLSGTNPTVVVLERQFYDRDYEHVKRVHWIQIQQNGCYSNRGMSFYAKETHPIPRKDKRDVGVLEFNGQIFFYNIGITENVPRGPGCEEFGRCSWYVQLFAPQKSIEEILSKEVKEEIEKNPSYPGSTMTWDYFCEISFD